MRFISHLSTQLARIELWLAAVLTGLISLLILLNVISRALGRALYWVDELAIFAMVWMTFLAFSVALKNRTTLAVNLWPENLHPPVQVAIKLMIDLAVLIFALLMGYFCLLWFDPIRLASVNFNVAQFQSQTFNFIYSENTNTLGLRKIWIWLILPAISLSLTLHSSVNLIESIRMLKDTLSRNTHQRT